MRSTSPKANMEPDTEPGDWEWESDDSEPTFGDIHAWQMEQITVREGFVLTGFNPNPQPRREEASAWECPRCGAMNAPHADRCDCKPDGTGE